ncbi:MAG: hypothetical protein JSW00_08555 [Thermoplasmata archaeon]|nr:MAG: hypothetical protein JSW00_08555 [Thermoplasmata archaeon]
MRKYIAIFGTLLIATILLSGSAVAIGTYAGTVYAYTDCENPEEALDEPDTTYATVGTNIPDPATGDLWLDFGFVGIPDSTILRVYGTQGSGQDENYYIEVWRADWGDSCVGTGGHSDLVVNNFTTGTTPTSFWRFVNINGETGSTGPGDTIYGPEIDAVGYD